VSPVSFDGYVFLPSAQSYMTDRERWLRIFRDWFEIAWRERFSHVDWSWSLDEVSGVIAAGDALDSPRLAVSLPEGFVDMPPMAVAGRLVDELRKMAGELDSGAT
jgi:hypothetical protein